MAQYEHNEEFFNLNYKEDRLSVFLVNYISTEEFKDLWYVCKIIFVLCYCQSNIDGGFSVNKDLQEKSLISQWLIHDT